MRSLSPCWVAFGILAGVPSAGLWMLYVLLRCTHRPVLAAALMNPWVSESPIVTNRCFAGLAAVGTPMWCAGRRAHHQP